MTELEELKKLLAGGQREPMTHLHLSGGDLLKDQLGRCVTLVRNYDTGDLFGVLIEGHGNPEDIRIENITQLGSYVTLAFTPIDTAYQRDEQVALRDAAVNALPGMIARVEEMEAALANMADCQPLPKIYKYTGTAEVDVENMFDVGHRHVSGKKPYDYLKSWLSMLRPFAYATQDDSWGELEKLISIVMNNYVQILVKAESARAALRKEP